MDRLFFMLGAAFGLIGVAAGAFGAHALQDRLPVDRLDTWETATRYLIYHALALLAVAWACTRWPGSATSAAGWLFVAGILLFSGSLYVLSWTGIRWLGAVTPFGGVAFLVGWACLIWTAARP